METRKEIVKISYWYWDGRGNKRRIVIKKGDSIRDVIEKCLKRIQKENKDLLGATPDTFMAIKADYILPNHILIMDILAQQRQDGSWKCKGKQEWQEWLFKISKNKTDTEELKNKDLFSDDDKEGFDESKEIEIDSGPMLKIVERRIYEQNRYMFPYYNWKTFELTGFRR